MKKLYLFLNDEYVGDISVNENHGEEIFSFSFSEGFLLKKKKVLIDPELFFYSGPQYSQKGTFGFINDMIPDRFGKLLIERKFNEDKGIPIKLKTSDYLLLVNDLSRMGAFRLKEDINGKFVNFEKDSIPPCIYLRDIEQASIDLDSNNEIKGEVINRLLLPGSSLGGARPKANIYFNDEVFIAKLPSKKDNYDVELLESIALDIAKKCDIDVPDFKVEKYSNYGHTLLVKRFDRDGDRRIHYMSALTALNATDGDSYHFSYLDLAEFIRGNSENVESDLIELYKRLVFSYLINNTDNHLRNHAFILKDNGYQLSPIFDVNPTPYMSDFELPLLNEKITKESIIDNHKYFYISKEKALELFDSISIIVMKELKCAIERYKQVAKELRVVLELATRRAE